MKIVCSLLLIVLLAAGCHSTGQEEPQSASTDIFAMDTYITITCYGNRCQEAVNASVAEIQRLDDLLSIGNSDSEICQINEMGSGVLSSETAEMVEQSLALYQGTDGAFDITIFPLMELWGFTSGNFSVPKETELANLLSRVGSDRLQYDSTMGKLTLGAGQGIDLGGIAKGYTSARLMELFEEYDLEYGVVSLGGNVQFYGAKPDGSLWQCGIVDPFHSDTDGMMGILSTESCAVITSGAYERYFTAEDGSVYHHILDPSTGYPAESGLASVTIISRNGMLADGLSTSCYVMGLEAAAQYWRDSDWDFDMILMTEDGNIYVTEPLQDRFETEYPLYVIDEEGIK